VEKTRNNTGIFVRGAAAMALQCAALALASVAQANAANRAPTISGSPDASALTGERYAFRPGARDADGDRLSFSVVNKPRWASFDPATGRLSGTPSASSAGTYEGIRIKVSDGRASDVLGPFSIVVRSPNRAPRITGTPATSVLTGGAYAFKPAATDADGDRLFFSIANRPAWATFSASTGRLAGTPPATAAGEYVGIRISVSDGKKTAALAAFSIVVTKPNHKPVIAGTPVVEALVGKPYQFQAKASDADGDALSFSVANKPAWATFDPATGRLSGTPGAAAAGTYANVTIRVTDGAATVSLPAFSIAVQQVVRGSATLTWMPPTEREDGSPLTNLAGYRIRYGTTPGSLTEVLEIPNGGITSAVIENLTPATWYFATSAYDSEGLESANSGAVSKTIT
jgi:putative Ig domain-containing protein